LRWRLTCAGALDRDRETVDRLRAQLDAEGLADRVDLAGDLDAARLAARYDRADLFVLPTLYEGYGMAVAEALARGLPVISTATGGIRALVSDEAGIVVAPGDQVAFSTALARAIGDAALRRRLAEGARRVRDRLPTWEDAAAVMELVLDPAQCRPPVPGSVPESVSACAGVSSEEAGFSADWLALREPADGAARSARLTRAIADHFAPGVELRVLDLGAGTGANMRYLAPRLPEPQRWLLVDRDAALLASVAAQGDGPRCVETRQFDLRAIGGDAGREMFSGRALVSASALLDLVSAAWVRELGARCRDAGATLLFALSYDGRLEFAPDEPEDAEVRALVNRHQQTDKGFGPALGPNAPVAVETVLAGFGYRVERERSDWVLEPAAQDLQRQLIEGWARAATEIAPERSTAIAAWRDRRLAHVAARRSRLVVGHEDIAAWIG
jgi:SAM-dependent methyltransferase